MEKTFSFSRPVILASLLVISLAQADDDVQDSVTTIEVNAAEEFVARHENAVIMDVRTPVEYEMSHITGSLVFGVCFAPESGLALIDGDR